MSTDTVTPPPKPHRARWAAIGAAVAVSLGAGGLGIVQATEPDGATAYVPIEPCRLIDTRSDAQFHVGPHSTLGGNSKITVDGWGSQGECTSPALPSTSTGLQLNVTALGATTATHLTIYPGAGDPPNSSSLNPVPGQPPLPNAVTTQLDGAGQFSVYNLQGSIDVIIDVVGYYGDHHHDDRYEPDLPDAMGFINVDGSIRTGEEYIDTITWNAGLGRYEITFNDFAFNINTDVGLATAATAGWTASVTSTGGSTFIVYMRNPAGAIQQGAFSFVVWDR